MSSSIGIQSLPASVRNSNILGSTHLAQLASVPNYPVIDPAFDDDHLKQIILYYSLSPDEMERELHTYAKKLLEADKINEAWQVLLAGSTL